MGFEFRHLPSWPQIFVPWPGDKSDAWGEYFKIAAGDMASLAKLNEAGRECIADLLLSLDEIVVAATDDLEDASEFLEDAKLIGALFGSVVDQALSQLSAEDDIDPPAENLEASEPSDVALRLATLETQCRRLRKEIDAYAAEFDSNAVDLASIVQEMKTFKKQIPQILNVVSAARAAAEIVGDLRVQLDSEAGVVTKIVSEFRRELTSVWDALDAIGVKRESDRG